jgi:hypothetical protein
MIRPPVGVVEFRTRHRSEPHLDVVLKYEAAPVVRVVAETAGDEARLLDWLRHGDVLEHLSEFVGDVVDQIDEDCA